MKLAVICAPGLGDALILQIVSYHLFLHGIETTLFTPHRFGSFFPYVRYGEGSLDSYDAIFLQHDNSQKSKEIQMMAKPVYTFYGAHVPGKHLALKPGFDFVADLNQTMVANVINCLKQLFQIDATSENGLSPSFHLIHRKHAKRVVIHNTSGNPARNWHNFDAISHWLSKRGYEPEILPQFLSLEELFTFLYESAFFVGNDSGPGHAASCLKIPHLVIGRDEKLMRHWRPGWYPGEILTPSTWIPRKIRQKYWKQLITKNKVIKSLKKNVLIN